MPRCRQGVHVFKLQLLVVLQLLHTLTTLLVYRVILTTILHPPNHPACVPRRRPGVWRFLSKSAVRLTVSAYTNDRLELAKVSCQFRVSALSQCSLCITPLRARLHLLVAMSFREPLPYLTTLSEHQVALTKHWSGHATTPAKPPCLRAAQSTGSVSPRCSNLPSLRQLPQTLTTLSAYQVILTTPLYDVQVCFSWTVLQR